MSEWVESTFDSIAEVMSGSPFASSDFNEYGEGLPLIRIRDVVRGRSDTYYSGPFDARFLIEEGRWLIGMDGEFNIAKWQGGQALLNQRVATVFPRDDRVDHEFLGLAIAAPLKRIEGSTTFTTVKHLSAKGIRAIPIALPPVPVQRRIVDVVAAVDGQIDALASEAERAGLLYRNALSLLWLDETGSEASVRPLGEAMALDIERRPLLDDEIYSSAGVLGSGWGLIDKGPFMGRDTEYSAMNVIRTDQVVMRKLTAWEGPISVVPATFDGYVASNEFPTFTLNAKASPGWMRHVCRTQRLWDEMKNRVTGTVQRRKRLNPDQLLAVELPIPSRAAQERITAGLDALDRECGSVDYELTRLRAFRSVLLNSLLSREIEIPADYDAIQERSV